MKHNKRFVMVDSDSAEDSESNRPPTHEEISVAAHEIYEEEGCPAGLADSHWYTAEARLLK
jgi:hypothetical protein